MEKLEKKAEAILQEDMGNRYWCNSLFNYCCKFM